MYASLLQNPMRVIRFEASSVDGGPSDDIWFGYVLLIEKRLDFVRF